MTAGSAVEGLDRARRAARLATGLPRYLRTPLDAASARDTVGLRLAQRGDRFLSWARDLMEALPRHPLCGLLAWAGCSYADLERGVRRDGLDPMLRALRDSGVRLSHDEAKGRVPIVRRGLEIATDAASFDNLALGGALTGRSSGSRGRASRVLYGWDFFAEEAADELLLYAAHDVLETPGGFWMPGPPSISGLHNLLVELKFRRAPRRFFSHLDPPATARTALAGLRAIARLHGCSVPAVEATSSGDALRVARWMRDTLDERRGCVLKAFASSAVRVAGAAREAGIDLHGALFLTGGEPLTATRRRFLERTGARAHARYVTTETGFVAGSCARDATGTTMHVYAERIALIDGDAAGDDAHRLLFTTLSSHSGKLLLNADLGDSGRLSHRACECVLGRAGLVQHVAAVHPRRKITLEGMTVDDAVLDEAVARTIEALGGAPDAYELREAHDASGLGRLELSVGRTLAHVDATRLADGVLAELARHDAGAAIAARCWRDAGTLRILRAEPTLTAGAKLPTGVRSAGS